MATEQPLLAPEDLVPAIVCDGGDLDCGSGLLLVIRRAMEQVSGGGVLEVRSTETSVREDLPAWCRLTGNPYLGWRAGEKSHRFFVQRGAQTSAETEEAERQARAYRWRVRARGESGATTVFARNHRWEVGQAASFDVRDAAPSAVEYVLGALAAALASGLRLQASREGVEIEELEVSLGAGLVNVFAFIGDERENGHSGLSDVTGSVYVRSSAPRELLTRLWARTLEASPIANTLVHPVKIDVELKSSP